MRVVFWVSLAVIVYAYAGYAVLLSLLAKARSRPVRNAPIQPPVSIIVAAHNEEKHLPAKLAGLYALDYPPSLLEIIIASDGSLNAAVTVARGELLVFMDARQSIDPDAITNLAASFADASVGAVSGELHLETMDGRPSPEALGIYWKIEKLVRKLESATGSVVGATGALFAMRRELYSPLPAGTLLDDVLTPMNVARAGKRVLFLDTAVARDRIFSEPGKEFGRKVRTLTGNYQLLQLAPWLLSPRNPLLFRLISHKLLRLLVPLLLLLMLLSSAFAAGPVYRLALVLQLLLYITALLGALSPAARRWRPVSIAYTFVLLNAAAAMAFYNFLAGRTRWA